MTKNPAPKLLPAAELATEVGLLQRRAARKVEDARRRLKSELKGMAENAARQVEMLDLGSGLDMLSIRHLCDPSSLADAIADVREAEMMAATVAELIAGRGARLVLA